MAGMADEESFVFVDKRKLGPDAADDAASQPDAGSATEEPIDRSDAEYVDEEVSGMSASYGLVAYVVGLIASDAWQKLGLIGDPTTGKVSKDMKQARFSIDCVAALIGVIDQSEAELPAELSRDLQRVLADLRLNYVEQSRRS
jgi:hypothetical protein